MITIRLVRETHSTKTAAYWEGWQCVRTRQPCRFTTDEEKKDWALGFEAGIEDTKDKKPWYRSKTLLVGSALLVFGILLWATEQSVGPTGGPFMSSGFGQGVTLSSLLMVFLRTITSEGVGMTSGQYTPPQPPI